MGAAAPPPEHRVRCLGHVAGPRRGERLTFEIDGETRHATLRIGQLTKELAASLPAKTLDLLDLATLVYAVDAAVRRGGTADQRMGAKWYRRFLIEMPVRDLAAWSDFDLKRELEEMLLFLSGDRFEFAFRATEDLVQTASPFFRFGPDEGWRPDRVLMFSGGLDSFAGALEEIVDHGNRVALISHFSSTKIAPIQRDLVAALKDGLGKNMARHFPVQIQLGKGTNLEGTHRTRSFLFAALGTVVALAFNRDRVSFHENGIVSLNLAPVANVLGTRASRTTHPQALDRFTSFFGQLVGTGMRIDNPFFWKTKTDVLLTISRLKMADQIAHTRSCADVHNQTIQHVHCGRCSQCIDRRFAVLAAGLERFDPAEAYRIDLLTGERNAVQDREMALSYLRNAIEAEFTTPISLLASHPEIVAAITHVGEPTAPALDRIVALLNRHGRAVADVIQSATDRRPPSDFPADSLPNLFGDIRRAQMSAYPPLGADRSTEAAQPRFVTLVFDDERKRLSIEDRIDIGSGATYRLLRALAEYHLAAAGKGLDPFDYPMIAAQKLAHKLAVASDEHVRKSVMRARTLLAKRFASAQLDPELGRGVIENNPWRGYRLDPQLVAVRLGSLDMG
ncbi:7-cyano-7-deazaguanine synthase [Defluviimonas aquaemixtae]|uniref:7-cyano-7-deazaguanine synthase n=1 Tax=Albidovulum aquaemixtae TaxID=1542388 RepID=A0A2R8BLT5_9RHOB|nr:7-cyano-7-deazaguanine synthase [Defluviimonas aquaemixtae]SPH24387.1 7-cyano-7-deazaguanine synthase [Defluviimonas aquaemixtae]